MGQASEKEGSGREEVRSFVKKSAEQQGLRERANQETALSDRPTSKRNYKTQDALRHEREVSHPDVTALRGGVPAAGDSKLAGEGTWSRVRQAGLGQPVSAGRI